MSLLTDYLVRLVVKLKSEIGSLLNFIFTASRIFRVKPNVICMGDSHISFLYAEPNVRKRKVFSLTENNELVIWLGPMLLYSTTLKEFSLNNRIKIVLRIAGNRKPIVVALGEIDCRVHFVQKTLPFGIRQFDIIAQNYKNFLLNLAATYNFSRIIVITPIPPSDSKRNNPVFPRVGSLAERALATKLITDSLVKISDFYFTVIDSQSVLSNPNGSLNQKYSGDGLHLNSLGSEKILGKLATLIDGA